MKSIFLPLTLCLIMSKPICEVLFFYKKHLKMIFSEYFQGSLILPTWQLTSCNVGTLGVNVTATSCSSTYCTVVYSFVILILNFWCWNFRSNLSFSVLTKTTTATASGFLATVYGCSNTCTAACVTTSGSYACVKCCTTDNCNTGTASSATSFKPIMSQIFLALASFALFFHIF